MPRADGSVTPRRRITIAVALSALVTAGAVAGVDLARRDPAPAAQRPAAAPVPDQQLHTTAKRLLVEPSAEDTARSLATLRRIDDHPLYEMTYYGPAPRLDNRPADQAHALPAPEAGRRPFACTVFAAAGDPDRPLFGRNFDWDHNPALILHANPAGAYRSVSIVDLSYFGFDAAHLADLDDPVKAKNLMGAPSVPFDGMNEHGLVIGMAAVDDGRAELRPGRPAVGGVGVMRLVLDQARSVDEAIKVLGSYNLDFGGGPPLHYIVADATGASAVVEFVAGQMRVQPRDPTDRWQVTENFHLATTPEPARAGHHRYRTATERLRASAGRPGIDGSLDLLRDVAQQHTQWSAVYDLRERSVTLFTDRRREHVHEISWR